MSDLTASQCGNNCDCGCNGGNSNFIWILLILFFCGGCNGCGNNSSVFGGNNNGCGCGCDAIIWIILLSCLCGNNNNGCGCF